MAKANEIKYLTAIKAEKRPKKYCRFKKINLKRSCQPTMSILIFNLPLFPN